MAHNSVKETLAQDISQWLAEGWITSAVYDTLAARYQVVPFALSRILRYIGITGGVFSLLGVLGLITALSQSRAVALVVLLGLAATAVILGLRLAHDPLGRYPNTARMLLTTGMLLYGGGLYALGALLDLADGPRIALVGALWLPVAFVLAYVYANPFLLTLAVLAAYHWIGSWGQMAGRSTYEFGVQDPRAMAAVAVCCTLGGLLQDRLPGVHSKPFATVYQSVGLLYLNLSLLILSIGGPAGSQRGWYVGLGALACLAQIVLGARLPSALFTGFGLTFAGIHLFTRYYEDLWDRMDKGLFFLLGGLLLFGLGLALERGYRRAAGGNHAG